MKRLKPLMVALLMYCLLVSPAFSEPIKNGVLGEFPPPDGRLPQEGADYDGRQMPIYERWYVVNAEGTFNTDSGNRLPFVLHLVKTVVSIRPSDAMRLLKEDKSLEEIRAEIDKESEAFIYRGYLQLGEVCYRLVDIDLTDDKINLTLNANLVEFQKNLHPGIEILVGHVEINATPLETSKADDLDYLTIDSDRYYGTYTLIPKL